MNQQTLGHYTLLEELGSGGMGKVYLAQDNRLQRRIALKVLPVEMAANPDRLARFEREARSVAALNHPNIVTIYSVENSDGAHFITMELVEGEPLSHRIPDSGFPLSSLLEIAIPLAEAVSAAHQGGITHRDLKPDNIMITPDRRVKVLDFGLAKLTDPDQTGLDATVIGDQKVTQEGRIMGTVAYMSPEQAEGKPIDHRSDIFSLGVVLYEMATGRKPFQGETSISTISAILRDTPRTVTEIRENLPPLLAHAIQRCLAKEPDRRYQTALDVRNELESLKTDSTDLPATPQAGAPQAESERKMIVVLPFENLGPADDEYFAAGITEEITSRLASVSGLGVISRTTAIRYDRASKTMKDIEKDLGVGYVLEGSVRWARRGEQSRVRVTPQLIRVSDDSHLWSDRYDRDLDDIFEVQSEIAEEVINKLNITLLEPEREALEVRPTDNMEAYQAYLRGVDYMNRPNYAEDEFLNAIKMFHRATELDPEFGLAHAKLSQMHSRIYHFGYDRSDQRDQKAKNSVDRAIQLDPDHPETHLALGLYYYSIPKDFNRAMQEFEIARIRLHNNSELLQSIAATHRRRGDPEAAIETFRKNFELNPQSANLAFEIGLTCSLLRRYEEAERWYQKSIAAAPDQHMAYTLAAVNTWLGWGDLTKARKLLDEVPDSVVDLGGFEHPRTTLLFLERDFEGVLDWVGTLRTRVLEEQGYLETVTQLRGYAHEYLGQADKADAEYESALEYLHSRIQREPTDYRVHSSMGLVLARLGRKEEAIAAGQRAMEILPQSKDAFLHVTLKENMAVILAHTDESEKTIDLLEELLANPGWVSVSVLRLDPRWDPLRDHPRFKTLVETTL